MPEETPSYTANYYIKALVDHATWKVKNVPEFRHKGFSNYEDAKREFEKSKRGLRSVEFDAISLHKRCSKEELVKYGYDPDDIQYEEIEHFVFGGM